MNKNEYTWFTKTWDWTWKREVELLIKQAEDIVWPNNYLTWEPTNRDFWKVHFKIKKSLTYDL